MILTAIPSPSDQSSFFSDQNTFLIILFCLFILVSVILVHGIGLRMSGIFFGRGWKHLTLSSSVLKVHSLLGITVAMLVLVHMIEVVIWAAPIYAFNFIKTFSDSYLFVFGNYTTIGSGIDVPNSGRIIAPMIAISGMFTFGWTGGMLASIMTQMGKRDHDLHVQKYNAPDDGDILISGSTDTSVSTTTKTT